MYRNFTFISTSLSILWGRQESSSSFLKMGKIKEDGIENQ